MMFKLLKEFKEPVLYVQKQKEERPGNSGLQPALRRAPRVGGVRRRLGRRLGDDVVQKAVGRHRDALDAPLPQHDAAEAVGPREELRDPPCSGKKDEVRGRARNKRFRGEAHRPRRS